MQFLHILPNTSVELNRYIAATKIQRAWRNRNSFYAEYRSEEGEESQAWKSTFESSRSFDFLDPSRLSYMESSNQHGAETVVDENSVTRQRKSIRRRGKGKTPSQVGAAMAKLTGRRVTIFLFANLLIVLFFTYTETNTTDVSTMVMLHAQTTNGNPDLHHP